MTVENMFHKAFITNIAETRSDIKYGIIRTIEEPSYITMGSCPAMPGQEVLVAVNDYYRNGYHGSHYISRNTPENIELPTDISKIILHAIIEDDMDMPELEELTGEDIEKYFSHSNFSFVHIDFDKKIKCTEIFYERSLESWEKCSKARRPSSMRYHFRRFLPSITRLVVSEKNEEINKYLEHISNVLNMSLIRMDRIDIIKQ